MSKNAKRYRDLAIEEAAFALADYVHCFGGYVEDLMSAVEVAAREQLYQLRQEGASARALEEKADRLGMRY